MDLLAFGVEGRAARNGIDDDGNSIVVEKSRPSHAVAQLPLDQIVARVQSQKSRSSNAARMKVPPSLCMGRTLLAGSEGHKGPGGGGQEARGASG